MIAVVLIIISYLIGSISFALLIAKMHGVDLRNIGSGNLGATNLSRACGKQWAYICFALDVLKGFIPVFIANIFIIPDSPTPAVLFIWLAIGAAAILGHIFPIYLNFKGGKGVATSFGVVLGIWPYYAIAGIIAFALWGFVVLTWKYISLGSVIAAAVFPAIMIFLTTFIPSWHFANLWPLILAAVILCSLVIYLHHSNIKRMIEGSENKVLQKD
ncbi:MAG: acyl-phosphate glycerol 3-phosphate acyltransferase [Planctomycetes bacterium GWF2_41_51]|nr:MAG: acyl-phosphate glycerol 3-phosphate acyltransferase [Planctomycetes bacterium GWF2_41_51]